MFKANLMQELQRRPDQHRAALQPIIEALDPQKEELTADEKTILICAANDEFNGPAVLKAIHDGMISYDDYEAAWDLAVYGVTASVNARVTGGVRVAAMADAVRPSEEKLMELLSQAAEQIISNRSGAHNIWAAVGMEKNTASYVMDELFKIVRNPFLTAGEVVYPEPAPR